jgi:hypothetical protein
LGIVAIILIYFLVRKIFQPKSSLDKIGIFTATPILPIITIWLTVGFNEDVASDWYFNRGGHHYKVRTINYKGTTQTKRIEFYRGNKTESPDLWAKDSTWLYFSKIGDTIKRVHYRNGTETE